MSIKLENNILVRENSRMYKENCDLKHLNHSLTSKFTEIRSKVENLLIELDQIPRGRSLKDIFRAKGNCRYEFIPAMTLLMHILI